MTGRVRSLVVLVTGLLLQATICTEFRHRGVSVELLLLVTVLAGYHGGPDRGAVVGFFAGLLHDSLVGAPLGLHALVFPPVAVAVSSLEQRMLRSTPLLDGLAVAAAVASGTAAASMAGLVFGQESVDAAALVERAVRAGVLTAVVAAPVNRVVRWSMAGSGPASIELRTPAG